MDAAAEQSGPDVTGQPDDVSKNRFGTFGGVFTPSILTILGLIMFMRANFIVGQAGILGAIGILVIAKSITFLTSLSIGAISTNMQVRGGGAYFLISRVLGPEFGGAIGIALFFALALSVPFYILGFTEALVRTFPALEPHFQMIGFTAGALLFLIAFVGANWAIKTQYLIMSILVLSILAFMGGMLQLFSLDTFWANLDTLRSDVSGTEWRGLPVLSIWAAFAIYFPAVTGIDAGVNMSGDLDDPAKSIPRGTLMAVTVGFLVYLLGIVLAGGAFARHDLIDRPFALLKDNALFGLGFFVVAGAFAATFSSALGSFLGAPRVLQAVSRDGILDFLRPFAKGSVKGDEPRRALLLTGAITAGVLLWAGNESEGGPLNAVAAILTMFFLYSYGMINLAAFIEAFGDNPSFRPRFRFFHWGTAMMGALGCVAVALLINWVAALVAGLLIALLVWHVKNRELASTFGDARRGFVYNSVRNNLLRLADMEEDPKNWRPTILVFSGNPASRETLVSYAVWMESGRGIVYLANILLGDVAERAQDRTDAIEQLERFCEEKRIQAFPACVVADDVEEGMHMLLQTTAVGPLAANMVVFGWSSDPDRIRNSVRHLRTAAALGKSLVLLKDRGLPAVDANDKRIDLWWRGKENGGLMMILAHLLSRNWEWAGVQLRVLRVVHDESEREPASQALEDLIDDARVEATPRVIVSERPYVEILHQTSRDATCVFLGFDIPARETERAWHATYEDLLTDLPTTIMVSSRGREDLFA